MVKLSVVIISENEEKFIADAVNSTSFVNGANAEPSLAPPTCRESKLPFLADFMSQFLSNE